MEENTPTLNIDEDLLQSTLETSQQQVDLQTKQAEATAAREAQETEGGSQLAAEQEDPRNKENWGLGGVVKEIQSALVGGTSDTANSLLTLPERAVDIASGEMAEEGEDYQPDWNPFVDEDNPIVTRTVWGGILRGLVHYGTMSLALAPVAAVGATGATAIGLGRAVTGIKALTKASPIIKGAFYGAGVDLVSRYSQDDNAMGMIADKYPAFNNVLATQDVDHPAMKTLKNVVEGMGIGLVIDGVLMSLKRGGGEAINQIKLRNASVNRQTADMAKREIQFDGPGAHKNKGTISDPWEGSPTSTGKPYDSVIDRRRMEADSGAYDGSPTSVTDAADLDNVTKAAGGKIITDAMGNRIGSTADMHMNNINKVYRGLVSDARYQADIEAVKSGQKTLDEAFGYATKLWQRTGLGREAADKSPREYLREFFKVQHRYFEGSPDEMIAWTSENVVASDLVVGSLLREIRDLGIGSRELFNLADLGSEGGPAKALYDKMIVAVTEAKRTRMIISGEFRTLDAGYQSNKAASTAARKRIRLENKALLDKKVQESVEAWGVALDYARRSDNDDLFQAVFETVSMVDGIHNLTDLDAYMRRTFKGGRFKGGANKTALWIKGLQGTMIHSILSGPKTAVRALMGTSTAGFLRPMSTALGAAIRGDGATSRAALSSANAMIEAIPESWKLFKSRLNGYWSGELSTIKSRYNITTKGDEQWALYTDWIEQQRIAGTAKPGDVAAFNLANWARQANDNNFFTYSTKVMASIDDTFGYLMSRAKAREKAMRQALDNANPGKTTTIDPKTLREAETRFLNDITDADGNILDRATDYAKKEITLTQDLEGFAKGLEEIFNKTPWAKPFFLFARTGVNGLNLTAKHTPLFNRLVEESRVIAAATPDDLTAVTRYGINTAEELANAQALRQGRITMGGSLIFMASMAYMNGGLSGNGPTDRRQRQVWIDAGWKPRSVRVGDVWMSYDAFEPFNLILSNIADVGDHMDLMGEEWTENNLQKLSVVLAQGITSKSYLAGIQQFVDLFAGGHNQGRMAANLLNNTLPLGGLRNELGKVFNPYMKELNSGIGDSIRNRNLLFEYGPGQDLPTKYDMLNGQPIKNHDFMTRMFNMVSPVQFNLDQGPGRKLLFESGYDLRQSTYYGPDSTDLTNHPRLRSKFQELIGKQNIELKLDKLAKDPRIIESIAKLNRDRQMFSGRRYLEPRKDYVHGTRINAIFKDAKRRAWAEMRLDPKVQELIKEQRNRKIEGKKSFDQTAGLGKLLVPTR